MSTTIHVPPARRLLALKALPGFADVPPSQLVNLGAHAVARAHEHDTILQRAGLLAETLHVVVRGRVRYTRDGDDAGTARPFALVGGLEALTGEPVGFTATAEENAVTLSIGIGVMHAVIADQFAIFMAVVADVARRTLTLHRRMRAVGNRGEAAPWGQADGMVATMAALVDVPELARLPVDVLATLAAQAPRRRFGAGEVIWRRGDAAEHALLPLRGRLACVADGGIAVQARQRVHLWGLEEMLAAEPRWYEARAEEKLEALVIEGRLLLDELEDDGTAALAFLHALAHVASTLAAYARMQE